MYKLLDELVLTEKGGLNPALSRPTMDTKREGLLSGSITGLKNCPLLHHSQGWGFIIVS
jgi:hypothetical protein